MPKSPPCNVIIKRLINLKKLGHKDFFGIWNILRDQLYRTPEYQSFLKEVRMRSAYLCTGNRCSRKGRHVHHIVRVYEDPSKAVDISNGTFLCVSCHRKEHKNVKIPVVAPSRIFAIP